MTPVVLAHGSDSLTLDPLAFGLAFFPSPEEEVLFPILDAYRERFRTFDSARIYGNLLQAGRGGSDLLLGRYLASRRIGADAVVITKGGHPRIPHMRSDRLDARNLRRDLEQSLRFLRRETVDLYYLHRDSGRSVEDVMGTLDAFVREGKVRFLGASNWTVARILAANDFAERNGLSPFVAGQIQDSYARLAKPPADPTIVVADEAERAEYVRAGLPYLAYTAQARGFLSRYAEGKAGASDPYFSKANLRRFGAVRRVAERNGVPLAAVALKPLLEAEAKIVPILSTLNAGHLKDALKAFDFTLTDDDRRELAEADRG